MPDDSYTREQLDRVFQFLRGKNCSVCQASLNTVSGAPGYVQTSFGRGHGCVVAFCPKCGLLHLFQQEAVLKATSDDEDDA